MSKRGHTGTSMSGSTVVSKSKRKKLDRARRAEERNWQRKSGPVTVYKLDPETGERIPQS